MSPPLALNQPIEKQSQKWNVVILPSLRIFLWIGGPSIYKGTVYWNHTVRKPRQSLRSGTNAEILCKDIPSFWKNPWHLYRFLGICRIWEVEGAGYLALLQSKSDPSKDRIWRKFQGQSDKIFLLLCSNTCRSPGPNLDPFPNLDKPHVTRGIRIWSLILTTIMNFQPLKLKILLNDLQLSNNVFYLNIYSQPYLCQNAEFCLWLSVEVRI